MKNRKMTEKTRDVDAVSENVTDIILESISDGVFTVDQEYRIVSFNRAAEEITGISREDAIGRPCWDVFRSNMCEGDCALKRTMKEGKSFINASTYIINKDKKRIPITTATSLLIDKAGQAIGGVETFRDHSLVEELRKELSEGVRMGDMVSASPSMKKIFNILPMVAESDSTVLIEGETGVGKGMLARALHNASPRAKKPFVAINCGALPDALLESELFGYKAGAFTNAVKDKPGLFSAAEGGAILLDEIGDTSPAFQVKLLRVLEEHEFLPLGAVKKETANIRIIAATNKNLSEMMANGEFRQDLFYRIDVVRLKLPPLRERMEDVPLLIERFIEKMNHVRGKSVSGVDRDALAILMAHDFPGNIRELENIIEHAFVLCSSGNIEPPHLPVSLSPQSLARPGYETEKDPVKSAEKKVIMDALERRDYNRKAAADDLGMHKSTLFRKIKKLGITLPKVDGRTRQS